MNTTEIKNLSSEQLIEKVQNLESQLADCLPGAKVPPITNLWEILDNGLQIFYMPPEKSERLEFEYTSCEECLQNGLDDLETVVQCVVFAGDPDNKIPPNNVNVAEILPRLFAMQGMLRDIRNQFRNLVYAERDKKRK